MKDLQKKITQAIKADFSNLYQKEFTADWKEQRIIRNIEIDVMSFTKLLTLFEEEKLQEYERGYNLGIQSTELASYKKDLVGKIEQIKQAVSQRHGTYKYDECYDDVLNIIKENK